LFIKLGQNAKVHHSVRTYGANVIGDNCIVLENVLLGFPDTEKLLKLSQLNLNLEHAEYDGTTMGNNVIIRSDAVIYSNVVMGNYVRTGHKILIRENTRIGSNVLIGTNTVIDNNCQIGSHVSIQSGVYLPSNTLIEDYVFLGPSSTLANDRYPIREKTNLPAPIIRKGASIGANATILPAVEVGEGAMVAAGAVVTQNVPAWHYAIGVPAKMVPLPEKLRVQNEII
jgi:acetyltransferase-like isoleucine patch superfamily enzyme